jgi:hypothetical protein
MKTTITCKCSAGAEYIYDLLVNSRNGVGVLSGEKICTDEHDMVPDIIDFDLTLDEIEEVKKLPEVASVDLNFCITPSPHYTKLTQSNIARPATRTTTLASGQSNNRSVSDSLYYCQNYELDYTQNTATTLRTLNGIDCSNVDIIIMDSGVDPTHPEFYDMNGNSTFVNFNWTQLKDDSGAVILPAVSVNYAMDTNGHGTTCAGLAAGKINGYAKNAKIYSLRVYGSTYYDQNGTPLVDGLPDWLTGYKLALAFQKAKKLNLYGLSSSRPTLITSSIGTRGYLVSLDMAGHNNANGIDNTAINSFFISGCIGAGTDLSWWYRNNICGQYDAIDAYVREILIQGAHMVVSAGNDNIPINRNNPTYIDCHVFYDSVVGSNLVLPRTISNDSLYTVGSYYPYTNGSISYNSLYLGKMSIPYNYNSPNIGIGYNANTYPLIVVGDITPIGTGDPNDVDANLFDSSSYSKSIYRVLTNPISLVSNPPLGIVINSSVRYTTNSGPFFVKTPYSNFGPSVDIYAPGRAQWSAYSNQTISSIPSFTRTSILDKNIFCNGTSAAAPIVAGILATYLAENPTATPLQAKNWLINNGIRGQIMQTVYNEIGLLHQLYNGTNSYTVSLPHGSIPNWWAASYGGGMSVNSSVRLRRNTSFTAEYNTANIYDVLFASRFFNSNNILAQAFPLRKAVLRANSAQSSASIGGTTLNKQTTTTQQVTHLANTYTVS